MPKYELTQEQKNGLHSNSMEKWDFILNRLISVKLLSPSEKVAFLQKLIATPRSTHASDFGYIPTKERVQVIEQLSGKMAERQKA